MIETIYYLFWDAESWFFWNKINKNEHTLLVGSHPNKIPFHFTVTCFILCDMCHCFCIIWDAYIKQICFASVGNNICTYPADITRCLLSPKFLDCRNSVARFSIHTLTELRTNIKEKVFLYLEPVPVELTWLLKLPLLLIRLDGVFCLLDF